MPKETGFQSAAIKYMLSRGAYAENIWGGPLTKKGRPDTFVCYRGCFIAFECKHPSMTARAKNAAVRKAQQKHIERIKAAGGVAIAVNTIEEIARAFNMVDLCLELGAHWTGEF